MQFVGTSLYLVVVECIQFAHKCDSLYTSGCGGGVKRQPVKQTQDTRMRNENKQTS